MSSDAAMQDLTTLQSLVAADASALSDATLIAGAELAAQLATSWRAEISARRAAIKEQKSAVVLSPCYTAVSRGIFGERSLPYDSAELPAEDHSALFTNVPVAFLQALMLQLRPSFLVEVGSWKGGSAVRIASAALNATPPEASPPCLLCIDTWLGDGGAWIDKCDGWRDGLMLRHGLPQLFWQFVANVYSLRHVILPWPAASLTALRALQHLVMDAAVPQADFVYLDAAHEKGETGLEIRRAFDLLRPGGVLVGDDLDWFAVDSDLRAFCTSSPAPPLVPTAADELLGAVPHLYPAAEGYWILDSVPRQWVLRKAEAATGADEPLAQLRAAVEADEYGADAMAADYVPLHDTDRAALRTYEQAVELSEAGRGREASRLYKQAAAASPSVAYHFKLEAFSVSVERSLTKLELPARSAASP